MTAGGGGSPLAVGPVLGPAVGRAGRPVALITGGSSGIGAAFARALAARGFDLVLVARRPAPLAELAGRLRSAGARVEVLTADLAVPADLDRVSARLADTEQPVQMLVNNAGFGPRTALTSADGREREQVFAVMMSAVLVLSGVAARTMGTRGGGTIVNVSSVAGSLATGSYSAAKAWTTNITESLAVELRGRGVRVTALLPGWVRTEFHQRAGLRTAGIPDFLWLDADTVVAECLRDVARGRVISIPSRRFKALAWLLRHLPRRSTRWVSGVISSSRKDNS